MGILQTLEDFQRGTTPTLMVGQRNGEIIINCHQLPTTLDGNSHIVFSPKQARKLAVTLQRQADEVEGVPNSMDAAALYIGHALDDDRAEVTPAAGRIFLFALGKSVELQGHYAGLLNAYDAGQRRVFRGASDWIARLVETNQIRMTR